MKNGYWWDEYVYNEDTLEHLIPNYKIERFKSEVNGLKDGLKEACKTIEELCIDDCGIDLEKESKESLIEILKTNSTKAENLLTHLKSEGLHV